MMTAESRDFRVATYSVVSLIASACATRILTGIAGSPWAWAPFTESPLQAVPSATRNNAASSPVLDAKPGANSAPSFELKGARCTLVPYHLSFTSANTYPEVGQP